MMGWLWNKKFEWHMGLRMSKYHKISTFSEEGLRILDMARVYKRTAGNLRVFGEQIDPEIAASEAVDEAVNAYFSEYFQSMYSGVRKKMRGKTEAELESELGPMFSKSLNLLVLDGLGRGESGSRSRIAALAFCVGYCAEAEDLEQELARDSILKLVDENIEYAKRVRNTFFIDSTNGVAF